MTDHDHDHAILRLSRGLMDRSGVNLEPEDWRAIAGFLAMNSDAMTDFQTLTHSKTEMEVVAGIWTPRGEVLCFTCHGPTYQVTNDPIPGYEKKCTEHVPIIHTDLGITRCERCQKQIAVLADVAQLHNLCLDMPKGFQPRMEQTSGMCIALGLWVYGYYYMVTVSEESAFCICSYYPDPEGASYVCHCIGEYDSANEMIYAITMHRFRR